MGLSEITAHVYWKWIVLSGIDAMRKELIKNLIEDRVDAQQSLSNYLVDLVMLDKTASYRHFTEEGSLA